jgi:hypothetical protein
VIFLLTVTLPGPVLASGGIQAFWWLAAAITLIVRSGKIPNSPETATDVAFSQAL